MLELRNITKAYPGVVANDQVCLTLGEGEILALLGENGAGKSTLMKILFGLVVPDSGDILIDGTAVKITSPSVARKMGIGMVQQHFALFEGMSVLENIQLGLDPEECKGDLRGKIASVAEKYGLAIDPDALVFTLSAGEKQRIEIVRTLLGDPRILVLDEPTSVLTPQEATQLFDALEILRQEGHGIIFISHKLGEVKQLCDSATVLRRGQTVATCDPKVATAEQMAEHMLGSRPQIQTRTARAVSSDVVLSARDAHVAVGDFAITLGSLDLHAGEIYGVAGVAGNGQEQLFQLLSGELPLKTPEALTLFGKPIGTLWPNDRRAMGAAFVPEERLGHSAVPDMSLLENSLLSNLPDPKINNRGRISWRKLRQVADKVTKKFDVRHAGIGKAARSLSGGNLQKFVVGRELIKSPKLLVINQPTWGVDMGAAQLIRKAIMDLSESGSAVVLISQDLDELLDMCDTLAVLNDGHLGQGRAVGDWTLQSLGLAMAGNAEQDQATSGEAA